MSKHLMEPNKVFPEVCGTRYYVETLALLSSSLED